MVLKSIYLFYVYVCVPEGMEFTAYVQSREDNRSQELELRVVVSSRVSPGNKPGSSARSVPLLTAEPACM